MVLPPMIEMRIFPLVLTRPVVVTLGATVRGIRLRQLCCIPLPPTSVGSILPMRVDGTVNLTLIEVFEPALGEKTVAPTLISRFVAPTSVLFEPLWPTVVLARTKLLKSPSLRLRWLRVEITFTAIARLMPKGPLTVSMILFMRSMLSSLNLTVGKLSLLTPRSVRLALGLALISPVE